MKKTPLHELHLRLGARLVPFAGYEMPVQYAPGILKEHLHTRAAAGLFDVSHMGRFIFRGSGALAFLQHVLARVDWRRDLHFQTRTTIDTLDYSGTGLHRGSKLVVAAVGRPRRSLPTVMPPGLRLPDGFADARVCLPGVLAVRAPASGPEGTPADLAAFCAAFRADDPLCIFPLLVLVDDSEFCGRSLDNFLWVTFSRSNPAADVGGIEAATADKHWGCQGSLVIDARRKPQHAPLLVEDPQVTARVDGLFAQHGPLAGIE